VEAVPIERVLHRDGPAEARPAVEAEVGPAREVQVQHVQERLVPTDRDPVLGDPSESRGHALVQSAPERVLQTFQGTGQEMLGDRLDLEPVDPDHSESLVEQVMRERIAGGPHPHHQRVDPRVRPGMLPLEAQRVPAREQAPDLETPAHAQDVAEDAGLDLRDVDRILLW